MQESRRWWPVLRDGGVPVVSILVTIGVWEAVVRLADIQQYLLPAPSEIGQRMVGDAGLFLTNAVPTVEAILLGFLLAVVVSLPLAIAMVYWPAFNKAVYPLLVVSQVVPKIALAPLFVIWLGFGPSSKILMAFLISFFPVVIDAITGLASVRPGNVMLFRSMGSSLWKEFWKLRLPHALPQVFAGLKVGITFAVVGEIVGEFVGADEGLGYLLTLARGSLDTVTVFAVIVYLVLIGGILFGTIELLERWLVKGNRGHARENSAAGT